MTLTHISLAGLHTLTQSGLNTRLLLALVRLTLSPSGCSSWPSCSSSSTVPGTADIEVAVLTENEVTNTETPRLTFRPFEFSHPFFHHITPRSVRLFLHMRHEHSISLLFRHLDPRAINNARACLEHRNFTGIAQKFYKTQSIFRENT